MIQKESWYRELEADKIPGGLADEKSPSDFDSGDLEKGIKVELEHTDSREIAQEIAMDHLTEDSGYYHKLEIIEARSAGEELPESGGEETSPWVPTNPQAFYYWIKEELNGVVESGHPANLGGRKVDPPTAQRILQFLEFAPVQTAYRWVSKVFPPKYMTTRTEPGTPEDRPQIRHSAQEQVAVPIGGMVPYEWEIGRLLSVEHQFRSRGRKITKTWERYVDGLKEEIHELLQDEKYSKKCMLRLLKAWDEALLYPSRIRSRPRCT